MTDKSNQFAAKSTGKFITRARLNYNDIEILMHHNFFIKVRLILQIKIVPGSTKFEPVLRIYQGLQKVQNKFIMRKFYLKKKIEL